METAAAENVFYKFYFRHRTSQSRTKKQSEKLQMNNLLLCGWCVVDENDEYNRQSGKMVMTTDGN